MSDTTVRYSVKETAAAMRKALKEQFPGVKFSVTMGRGTGYGWLRVAWVDGPTTIDVDKVTFGFQDERFDGMDDSYHQIPGTPYSCSGVNTERSYSPEAVTWAQGVLDANPGLHERDHDWIGDDGVNHAALRRVMAANTLPREARP